jgi:protein involved in polysaccharide export with SLBB domain
MEAYVYNVQGQIALDEGTEESARRAVIHFENQLRVNEAISDAGGIAPSKKHIAVAKTQFERGNIEEILKVSQDVYKLFVAQYGEESESAIHAVYAVNLQKANRGEEARDLLS